MMDWTRVCELDDVLAGTGVCALVAGRQIALFRLGRSVFAMDNRDPASGINVLSRGLLGDAQGERVVASPLYKHHYSLTTGRCLEDPDKSVAVYPVRVLDGHIWVNATTVGIELHSAAEQPASDIETLVLRDPKRGVYKRLTLRANRLHGVVLYGDARHGQWYSELMATGRDVSPFRGQLLFGPPAQGTETTAA